jgi:rhamnosyl/mannosyltransferase
MRPPDRDKVALIQLSFAVVFPSHLRSEAFGISLLEGAMYGKPMISSEIGTRTTFVNVDRETDLVVLPSDPAAFKPAMRFLADNPELAAKMGARARERYENLFTADGMVSAYCELYETLLKDRPKEEDNVAERKSA